LRGGVGKTTQQNNATHMRVCKSCAAAASPVECAIPCSSSYICGFCDWGGGVVCVSASGFAHTAKTLCRHRFHCVFAALRARFIAPLQVA
jgi:hypothetical protein